MDNLFKAISTGNAFEVNAALLNMTETEINSIHKGETPLTEAAKLGFNGVIKVLVDHGAYLDMPNKKGKLPYETAMARGNYKTWALLRNIQSPPSNDESMKKLTAKEIIIDLVTKRIPNFAMLNPVSSPSDITFDEYSELVMENLTVSERKILNNNAFNGHLFQSLYAENNQLVSAHLWPLSQVFYSSFKFNDIELKSKFEHIQDIYDSVIWTNQVQNKPESSKWIMEVFGRGSAHSDNKWTPFETRLFGEHCDGALDKSLDLLVDHYITPVENPQRPTPKGAGYGYVMLDGLVNFNRYARNKYQEKMINAAAINQHHSYDLFHEIRYTDSTRILMSRVFLEKDPELLKQISKFDFFLRTDWHLYALNNKHYSMLSTIDDLGIKPKFDISSLSAYITTEYDSFYKKFTEFSSSSPEYSSLAKSIGIIWDQSISTAKELILISDWLIKNDGKTFEKIDYNESIKTIIDADYKQLDQYYRPYSVKKNIAVISTLAHISKHYGVDIDQKLLIDAFSRHINMPDTFIKNGDGKNLAVEAAITTLNELDIIDAKGSSGKTLLMEACQAGNTEFIQHLIVNGADVDIEDDRGLNAFSYISKSRNPTKIEDAAIAFYAAVSTHEKNSESKSLAI